MREDMGRRGREGREGSQPLSSPPSLSRASQRLLLLGLQESREIVKLRLWQRRECLWHDVGLEAVDNIGIGESDRLNDILPGRIARLACRRNIADIAQRRADSSRRDTRNRMARVTGQRRE